ncbi:class I SAM-dependent methyltransferase [Rugosimonospora africana]|uniref:Methyltransferase type 11 domain-containing protein n=1 Tax=Rugosimonospora africana TaxID=556532 RepID=A0A8J3R775_9ACTN|nr:class I SAM-dependent methyltransferase [Rugosimonospora africana]GIH21291.1 hypothetical protein Raf01_94630 [Rugosimonospora africana]
MHVPTSESPYAFDNSSTHAQAHHSALSDLRDAGSQARISEVSDLRGAVCADIGAGAGGMAVWLAGQVGSTGQVLATDINPDRIPAHPQLLAIRHDIMHSPLPEPGHDLVVCRFVLNHLPERLAAVDNIIASTRPGGVILTEDFLPRAPQQFVEQAPSDEDAQVLLRFESAYLGVLAKHGNDRYWSVRAGEVFKRRGLIDVDVQESSGLWQGGGPGVGCCGPRWGSCSMTWSLRA